MKYPAPDRSDFSPNQHVDDPDMREGDLGYSTGTLPDGRPYRSEQWWWEGYALVTYFFSVMDLESATPAEIVALLGAELEAARVPERHRSLSKPPETIVDASGNTMYSATFVVGEPRF